MLFKQILPRIRPSIRQFSQISQGSGNKPPSSTGAPAPSSQPKGINANVPGLSNRVVKSATGPVGPGAAPTAEYKVPEYFCYDRTSYFEAELEMAKFRIPQPSAEIK